MLCLLFGGPLCGVWHCLAAFWKQSAARESRTWANAGRRPAAETEDYLRARRFLAMLAQESADRATGWTAGTSVTSVHL
jgi:hypothetical protein